MGKTSSKNFLQTIRIKVIATDGYTTAEDNLEIRIYLIPFATVINYIISIIYNFLNFYSDCYTDSFSFWFV